MRGTASIDAEVYATPSAATVAKLVDSHGLDAAVARWFWMGERTLGSMARSGRAAAGQASTVVRARTWSDLDAAVAVEAAFALGSMRRGERAAGLTVENAGRGICQSRGIAPPCISAEERGLATRLGRGASRGDAEAVAARDARSAHELAVGAVIRAALALVPAQPFTGRYLLPPVDARLAEALAGHDPAAVAAVFPGLAAAQPELGPETTVTAIVPPSAQEIRPMAARRRVPTDNVLLAERRRGHSVARMASDWEVTPAAIYAALRRLGVPAGEARKATPRSEPAAPAPSTVVAVPPSEPIRLPVAPQAPAPTRLSVDDLARAVALAQREGLTPEVAVRFVRADVAAARPAPPVSYPYVPTPEDEMVADVLSELSDVPRENVLHGIVRSKPSWGGPYHG